MSRGEPANWAHFLQRKPGACCRQVRTFPNLRPGSIYPRAPFQTVPLPKPIGRVVCFAVAGIAIYILVGDLRTLLQWGSHANRNIITSCLAVTRPELDLWPQKSALASSLVFICLLKSVK